MDAYSLPILWTSVLALLFSLALGLYGLFFPNGALKLVGLKLDEERDEGISEVRSTYGGFFVGISGLALLTLAVFDNPFITVGLGTAWLFAGFARVTSVLLDGTSFRANIQGILAEFLLGFFLIVPPLLVYRPGIPQ